MKKMYFLLTMVCLILFTGCKPNRIDHETDEYIYVWEYDVFGDSTLYRYHQPIKYVVTVVDKKKTTSSAWVVHPKGGGHAVVSHHYHVYYIIGGEKKDRLDYDLFNKVNVGDKVIFLETFYPYHDLRPIKIIHIK